MQLITYLDRNWFYDTYQREPEINSSWNALSTNFETPLQNSVREQQRLYYGCYWPIADRQQFRNRAFKFLMIPNTKKEEEQNGQHYIKHKNCNYTT